MRRAILLILFGILMNTADMICRGEAPGLALTITRIFFAEANHEKHMLMAGSCRLVSEWSDSESLTGFIALHIPFTFESLIARSFN